MSVLSQPDILKYYNEGLIVIDPFNIKNLANASYDVRLGKYFYRQSELRHTVTFNPFDEKSLNTLYTKNEEAESVSSLKSQQNPFINLSPKDRVIIVAPGETILAHTIEFVGGKNSKSIAINTEMRARSSIGRIGISVCKCAGWGDIGYINRWTMEITNFSSAALCLPVGLRIAQMIFHAVGPIKDDYLYSKQGKYQKDLDLAALKKSWKPSDMLPTLYKDRDLGTFYKYNNH